MGKRSSSKLSHDENDPLSIKRYEEKSSSKKSKKKVKKDSNRQEKDVVCRNLHTNDEIWSNSSVEEKTRIREFWASLSRDEQQRLVQIQKSSVIQSIKDQQKHNCQCSVCGRKRSVLEEELQILYEAYYAELEQLSQLQHKSNNSENAKDVHSNVEKSVSDLMPSSAELVSFGNSLTVKDGVLTVVDDLLQNNGKVFIDLIERLSEWRNQKENYFLMESSDSLQMYDDEEVYDDTENEYLKDDYAESFLNDEQRIIEGRRMFQFFAARMFEQRLVQAYREKVATERQRHLLAELEEETRQIELKAAKKAKAYEKKRDKKRRMKKLRDEELAKMESERIAAEAIEEERIEQVEHKVSRSQETEQLFSEGKLYSDISIQASPIKVSAIPAEKSSKLQTKQIECKDLNVDVDRSKQETVSDFNPITQVSKSWRLNIGQSDSSVGTLETDLSKNKPKQLKSQVPISNKQELDSIIYPEWTNPSQFKHQSSLFPWSIKNLHLSSVEESNISHGDRINGSKESLANTFKIPSISRNKSLEAFFAKQKPKASIGKSIQEQVMSNSLKDLNLSQPKQTNPIPINSLLGNSIWTLPPKDGSVPTNIWRVSKDDLDKIKPGKLPKKTFQISNNHKDFKYFEWTNN